MIFKQNVSGCCDCGDPDSWNIEGNCPDHKGILTTFEEISKCIQSTFSNIDLNLFITTYSKLFKFLNSKFKELTNKEVKDIETLNLVIFKIKEAFEFIVKLCKNNQAVLHITTELMNFNYNTENTPKYENFNIIQYNNGLSDKVLLYYQVENQIEYPFLKTMITNWIHKLDSMLSIDTLLLPMLNSKFFKIYFGIAYLSSYDIIHSYNSSKIKSFSVQILTLEDLSSLAASNSTFINNLFE